MSIDFVPGGHLTTPLGFRAGAVSASLYDNGPKAGGLDLALLVSDRQCAVAGVFTQNLVKGAPVLVTRERIAGGRVRAIVVNSGYANALNGPEGRNDAIEMTRLAAAHLGLAPEEVAVASTGLTGARLPLDKIRKALPSIEVAATGGPDFARAIMTTDSRPKEVALRVTTPAGSYAIGGCAKGSGMIHPNMATMLCYVTTDAAIAPELLQEIQREVADETLNMVSIDGDTSCSDSFLVFANGAAGLALIEAGTAEAALFRQGLQTVATHLAKAIARDGEGASHLIEVVVRGAASVADARLIARTITTSPLTKTAIAGRDPNWGRIMVAAGRAGAALEEAKARLSLQGELLFAGNSLPFDEAAVAQKMDAQEVRIELDLGLGTGEGTAWGCDLTSEYVHINADYRT